MDKEILNAIRICVMSDEKEKVFEYMDQLNFTQSLNLCAKLCDKLKAQDLAQKVSKFIQEKETREVFMKQLPHDKQPFAPVVNITNGKRVQAEPTPISFSNQFKNEKPGLILSSQVSQAVSSDGPTQKRVEAKTNPFVKKVSPIAGPSSNDVFADLKKPSSSKLDQMSNTLLQKRTNPFSASQA